MKKILFIAITIILIPLLIVGVNHKDEIIDKIKFGVIDNKKVKVKIVSTGEIKEIPLEKYVLGVVAGEMPATFNIEALKAQAVASRTYVLKKTEKQNAYDVEDGTNSQVYIEEEKMKEKWKENYNKNLKKIKKAVKDTKGEVLLYNNNLIDAMFFSTSNGYTENSADVFSSDLPYLKSVSSDWDKTESPVFNSTNSFSKKEFLFNLGFTNTDKIDIKDIKRTETGRVKTLIINNKIFDAKKIRTIFNLKSTSFTIKIANDQVIFNVNGFGHGVGMSQYGANGMAKEGYDYKDILKHYYQGTEIKKIN